MPEFWEGDKQADNWWQGDEAVAQGRSWWLEPVSKKLQRVRNAAVNAWEVGGVQQVKMFGGVARGITEPIPDKIRLPGGLVLNLGAGVQTKIQDWGEQTVAASNQYLRENPLKLMEIESSGLLPVLGELLSNPDKLLGAMIENLPLLLEGTLATVVTGGLGGGAVASQIAGGAAMTVPLFGDTYNEAREEGATPNSALARAIVGAPIEAGIEQFTLGKKLGLMRKIMGGKSIGGLKGLAWEVNKAYWRGTAEEGTQQFNRNFWRWAMTDRNTNLMKGVVNAAALGGPLEAAYAGAFSGAGFISTPHSARERIQRLEKIRETVKIDDSLNDEAKTEINNTLDIVQEEIVEEMVEVLIEQYPQEMKDDKSLAELGDAMAKEFGIDAPIKFGFKKRNEIGTHWGLHKKVKGVDFITIYSQPGHNTQRVMKETLIHELGHVVKPPKDNKKPPLARLPRDVIIKEIQPGTWRGQRGKVIYSESNTKTGAIDMALRSVNNERQHPRKRSIHYPEFEEWVSEAEKILDPKTVTVAAKDVKVVGEEAPAKIDLAEVRDYSELNPKNKIKVTTVEGIDTMTVEDAVYRLEELTDPKYYDGLAVEEAATAAEEVRAIRKELDKQAPTPTERYEARAPKKKSKKALLYLGHEIPKRNGITENELKEEKIRVTKQFSGRDNISSMGKMTKEEMENWVAHLENTYGTIEYTKEDLEKPIQVGNRVTTMLSLLREIEEQLGKMPERVKIPEHVARKYRRKLEGGRAKQTWDFLVGIDNSNLSTLAWILGGGKNSVFTDIFHDNIQRGRKNEAQHISSVYHHVQQRLSELKISDEDLAQMSRANNPRFAFLDAVPLDYGIDTEILPIKIGKRTYDVTWAELIDFYLISLQKDGMRHLLSGGLEISSVETGLITENEVEQLQLMVENNDKAFEIAKLFREIDDKIWKPSINQTSMRLIGKLIATVKNWWGLEVLEEKRLPGKRAGFNVNLTENKSILRDRTKSSAPLVLRDAFSRFDRFEKAIAEYSAMSEPTRVARTVLNHQRIASALKAKGYGKVRSNILEIMRRAQQVPATEGSFGKLIRGMLHGAYRAILSFSARVIGSQKTSEIVYSAFIDPKYYPKAAKEAMSRKAMDDTLEMSPIAWARFYMGHGSYELGELAAHDGVLQGFTKKASWANRLTLGLKMADLSALTTGMEIAKAEYKDAQAETITGDSAAWWADKDVSFKEGSESWRKTVSDRAEFLWVETQPSWDKWSRSLNLSQPDIVKRVASGMLFRSFHEKALNVTQKALVEFQNSPQNKQDYTRASRKIGAVMASYTVNAAMRAVILAAMTGKIKEPWEYMVELVTTPFSMVTFLGRQMQQTIQNFVRVLKGEKVKFYGRLGDQLPISIIQTLVNATNNFATGTAFFLRGDEEKGKENYKKALWKTYEGIGLLEGVPVYEIRRLKDRLEGKKAAEGVSQYRR